MSTSRSFAYNTGTTISGTKQFGSLAIDTDSIQDNTGGVKWWMGPDEDLGYVVALPVPSLDHSTPIGNIAGIEFYRSKALDDPNFLSIVNFIGRKKGGGPFADVTSAKNWLDANNYWTTYVILTANLFVIGSYNGAALDKYGQIWCWGANSKGQLGNNSTVCQSTPVSILGTKKTFCKIAGMGSYGTNTGVMFGIDYKGQVWGWGYNRYGEIGNNTIVSNSTPVSILGVKKTFCNITSSGLYAAGIDKYGQVWGWGYNSKGQLGINSLVNQSTPVSILGAKKTFCFISGNIHIDTTIMGIDNKGQLWGWGTNNWGQLAINSVVCKSTPVSILGAKKTFCSVISGNAHALGLDYKGQVWGWGFNYSGQLGINSLVCKSTPVSILGAKKTFCKIGGLVAGSSAIDYKGQIWCWGANSKGQLGNNSIIYQCTPISILGTKKTFCSIANGFGFDVLCIDYKGQAWGWGYNNKGQLGNNRTIDQLTPVRICHF